MKLLIVDDHPIVRNGIKMMFAAEDDSYELFEASNLQETLTILRKETIDICLMDLKLGSEDGLKVIQEGKGVNGTAKFVLLTAFVSEIDFIRGEEIGADGYILKDAFAEDIIYAVKTIMKGKRYYDPSIVSYKFGAHDHSLVHSLTAREKDVLVEMSKGASNMEISEKLFLSESTVKKHVSSILSKLNLSHRSQVVYYVNNN